MERNNYYLFSVQRDLNVNPPLKSLLDMSVLKFKFIVIRCYKICFFLLPRALATKRLLFSAITVLQKRASLSAMFWLGSLARCN